MFKKAFKAVAKVTKKVTKAVVKVTKKVAKVATKAVKTVVKVAKVVTKCVGGVVVSAGKCAVNTVGNAIEAVGDMFKGCWQGLLHSAKNAVGKAHRWGMDLVDSCSSLQKCKKQFVDGARKMWDQVKKVFKNFMDKTLFAGEKGKKIKKGLKTIENLVKKVPKIAQGVANAAVKLRRPS